MVFSKQLVQIGLIFVLASIAWAILGVTIFARTHSTCIALDELVISSWGSRHDQSPPVATCDPNAGLNLPGAVTRLIIPPEPDKAPTSLPLESSRVDVAISLQHRQKGLLWYNTYSVVFDGVYVFRNVTSQRQVKFEVKYPASGAIYDDLLLSVDDNPVSVTETAEGVSGVANVTPGSVTSVRVAYRSKGLNEWRYSFGSEVAQVRDFSLRIATDFKEIDFPNNMLSPSEKRQTSQGWDLTWQYKNMVSRVQIGLKMPDHLQPGPLAGRVSLFAPVSLFLFFAVIFVLASLRGIELRPMNYALIAAAFFSFHLLLAYLVDHVSLHAAFAISSAVSILLVTSYLRLVAGWRFAVNEAAPAQIIYLVLFAYAFLLKEFTGLALVIGSILTLFGVMQLSGRVKWSERNGVKSLRSIEAVGDLLQPRAAAPVLSRESSSLD